MNNRFPPRKKKLYDCCHTDLLNRGIYFFLLLLLLLSLPNLYASQIRFDRVPDAGIQPQVLIDPSGRAHLLFFKGDPMGGDIFYSTKSSDAASSSKPMQINSVPGSVIVAGTMRGPQLSLGANGQPHVVWMGGNGAPKMEIAGEKVTPLFYTRLAESGDKFEPQKNLLTHVAGLDGGQTVAADPNGNVYVIWHGAPPGVESEEDRGLYIAHSGDSGKSFAREAKAELPRKGACACCGIRARIDPAGALHVLFRAAESGVNRSELWLKSLDHGKSFLVLQEDPWNTATCPASSASLSFAARHAVGAWETDNRVVATLRNEKSSVPLKLTGKGKQKHPTVAVNAKGQTLVTWVEDAGWGTPGTLVCQVFNEKGEAQGDPARKTGLPAWSFGAPYLDAAGNFVVLY